MSSGVVDAKGRRRFTGEFATSTTEIGGHGGGRSRRTTGCRGDDHAHRSSVTGYALIAHGHVEKGCRAVCRGAGKEAGAHGCEWEGRKKEIRLIRFR